VPGSSSAPLRDGHLHLEATLRLALASVAARGRDTPPAALFETVLLACARDCAAAGAGDVLLRYNPLSWVRHGVPLDDQKAIAGAVIARARTRYGVAMRIYVSLKREAPEADLRAAVDFALAARQRGVEGIDVSRSYDVADPRSRPARGVRPHGLAALVSRAREAGLQVAMHCGWYDGSAELVEAIRLGAARIGHAVSLAERPRLVAELVARDVTVEVCPSAFERRTRETLAWLPLECWHQAGLRIEVGTDHPLALGTDIAREHRKLQAVVPQWRPRAADGRQAA
jgi:aminodeoxyfutalosine deaminase